MPASPTATSGGTSLRRRLRETAHETHRHRDGIAEDGEDDVSSGFLGRCQRRRPRRLSPDGTCQFGDMQYLNEIRMAWADCNEITRTGPASDKPVAMLLRTTDATTALVWTDMLGESFERQWTDRAWTRSYQAIVDDAVGVLLFIHPQQLKESELIIDAQKTIERIAAPHESQQGAAFAVNSDATDGTPSPQPSAAAADVEQPQPFNPRTVQRKFSSSSCCNSLTLTERQARVSACRWSSPPGTLLTECSARRCHRTSGARAAYRYYISI